MFPIDVAGQHTEGAVEGVMSVSNMEPQDVDPSQLPTAFASTTQIVCEPVDHSVTNIVRSSIEVDVHVDNLGVTHEIFEHMSDDCQRQVGTRLHVRQGSE